MAGLLTPTSLCIIIHFCFKQNNHFYKQTYAEEVVTTAKTCINEENELITAAETEWLNGHIQLVNGKIKADSDYINDVNSKNTSLINALGSTYRSDYDNWTNLLAGKATAYNNFINAIKGSQINLGDGSSALSDYGKAKAIVNKWNSASFKNNNGNDPLNLSNNTRNGISKEAYEKAILYTPKEQCLFIGDNYQKDIEGPKAFGLDAVQITDENRHYMYRKLRKEI